jgi:hypothetical protein
MDNVVGPTRSTAKKTRLRSQLILRQELSLMMASKCVELMCRTDMIVNFQPNHEFFTKLMMDIAP